MKGYVNNEKATKEKIDENGWFHTGDAGFYDDSQKVYVKGRMNDMFKVEGNMVSGRVRQLLLFLLDKNPFGVTQSTI